MGTIEEDEQEQIDKFTETWHPNPLTLQSQVNEIIFNQNMDINCMELKEEQKPNENKDKDKPSIVIEASYSEDAMQQFFAEYGTMPESIQTMAMDPDQERTPDLFNQYTIDKVQTYF